jgi:hypothetical protein
MATRHTQRIQSNLHGPKLNCIFQQQSIRSQPLPTGDLYTGREDGPIARHLRLELTPRSQIFLLPP